MVIMPIITCPYCQKQNASKFIHKQHVREEHPALFERNIRTSITGNTVELKGNSGDNSPPRLSSESHPTTPASTCPATPPAEGTFIGIQVRGQEFQINFDSAAVVLTKAEAVALLETLHRVLM